jgi:hypothetical protein
MNGKPQFFPYNLSLQLKLKKVVEAGVEAGAEAHDIPCLVFVKMRRHLD